jgi:hypothetical protein
MKKLSLIKNLGLSNKKVTSISMHVKERCVFLRASPFIINLRRVLLRVSSFTVNLRYTLLCASPFKGNLRCDLLCVSHFTVKEDIRRKTHL